MTTIVSYSEVFKWDTCQRQYYYRFGLGLKPLEESDAIVKGVKGHKLLQSFYSAMQSGKTKEEALALTQQSAKNLINNERVTDFSLIKAWTLVDNYIKSTDFRSSAILVENRFLFPAATLAPNVRDVDDYNLWDVQIGFTPDVVFERKGGMLDVEDSKFVARAWSKSKLNRFQQAKLYQIFLKSMGYNISRSVIRFFNTTTGEIKEQPYTLSKGEEETLIHDFFAGVAEILRYKQQPEEVKCNTRRTMNYTACQFCAFEFPCTLEAEGKDASKTLKNLYTKSDYDYSV